MTYLTDDLIQKIIAHWSDTHHKGEPIMEVWNKYFRFFKLVPNDDPMIEKWERDSNDWCKRMTKEKPARLREIEDEVIRLAA